MTCLHTFSLDSLMLIRKSFIAVNSFVLSLPVAVGLQFCANFPTAPETGIPGLRNFPTAPETGIPGLRKLPNGARNRYTGFIF